MKKMIFTMPGAQQLAEDIADLTKLQLGQIKEHIFPDGETLFRVIDPVVGTHVYLVARLDDPDPKTFKLLLLAEGFRQQGALSVTLITPYLPYMRQDTEFTSGEVISAKVFARVISTSFDHLITIDPHLHRYESLEDLYEIPTLVVSSSGPIADWIAQQTSSPFILGPDEESQQWVSKIAERLAAPFSTLTKVRKGDDDVDITLKALEIDKEQSIVLVDDIISSGATLLRTVEVLQNRLPDRAIYCCVSHCLATPETLATLEASGIQALAATESVKSSISTISIAEELTAAISADNRLFR